MLGIYIFKVRYTISYKNLVHGPSHSCQGGVLHAPWRMHLTRGTHKQSPEASGCSVHCNCCVADPLQSHCHLEQPPGDAASPNHQDDSWGTSLRNRAGPLQHPTAWAANSPVTTVLVLSQQMRMMMHTLRSVHPSLGTFKRPPELFCMTEPTCCSIQLHGQPTALSQLFSFTGS